jgi:hypothetical protein
MVHEGREPQAHRHERYAMQGTGRRNQRVAHHQEFTTTCYQYVGGRSRANSLVIAHEEWNLQHLFEVFDLNTERGLREIEALCGNADVTCFCDRNEVLEFL